MAKNKIRLVIRSDIGLYFFLSNPLDFYNVASLQQIILTERRARPGCVREVPMWLYHDGRRRGRRIERIRANSRTGPPRSGRERRGASNGAGAVLCRRVRDVQGPELGPVPRYYTI